VTGPLGAQVTPYETTAGTLQPLGTFALTAPQADVPRAARWRCHTILMREGRARAAWRFRPGLAGRWRVRVPHGGRVDRGEADRSRHAARRGHLGRRRTSTAAG
jgi:hypothetical protein